MQIDPLHDMGSYTCIVRSRSGEEARRDIQINVNSPPVIEPFFFPKNVPENGRAQISCSVSSGDMPVYFSWFKDGSPLPLSLQVCVRNICGSLFKVIHKFSFHRSWSTFQFLILSDKKKIAQVMEKKDDFFSLLIFKDITARHSGKYTCYATNSAAKVNYTAELFVKGSYICGSLSLCTSRAPLVNIK